MNTKVDQAEQAVAPADVAKYVLAFALAAAVGIVAFTAKGRQGREYLSESLFELRKVVWPTRQETLRVTGVILAVVIIISLILSLFDLVISWLIRLLLGQ